MMSIKDLEYLKGFTLISTKNPLTEAWNLLKGAEEEIEKREFSAPVDPLAELGPQTTEQECDQCQGHGYILVGRQGVEMAQKCPGCKGTGHITTHTPITTTGEGLEGYP